MSAGTQLSMNPALLTKRNYSLDGGGQFQPSLVASAGVAHALYISSANSQCSVDFSDTKSYSGAVSYGIRVNPSSVKAFRFLPYRDDHVTYTELDANAQLVLTGPLTGCFVYAAKLGARTILLHANANAVSGANNAATKIGYINAVLNAHYAGANITGRLVFDTTAQAPGATEYDGYVSFVIGCKAKSGISLSRRSWTGSTGQDDWTFYVYGYNNGGRILRQL